MSRKRGYPYIRILDFPQTGDSAGGVGGSRRRRVPNSRVEYHVSVGNPTIIPTRPARQGRFVWGVLSGAGHLIGAPVLSYSPRGASRRAFVSWSRQSRMNALTAARPLAARVAGTQRRRNATLLRATFEDPEMPLRCDSIVAMAGSASRVTGVDLFEKTGYLPAPGDARSSCTTGMLLHPSNASEWQSRRRLHAR